MSSPSLPDPKSLTDEIMELALCWASDCVEVGLAVARRATGPYDPSAIRPVTASTFALRSRLQSIESELTELREDARTNRIRTSGQAEAMRDLGVVSTTRTLGPDIYANDFASTLTNCPVCGLFRGHGHVCPVEFSDEEGG